MADLCSSTWNSILQLCFYNFDFHMIYLWLITVTHLCLQTVLLIITFVKATFVNYKCHHCHIRCCGVIWSAFTFSEELGFEEGWHGGFLPSWKWNLLTSWWFEHLHTLFMVEWHTVSGMAEWLRHSLAEWKVPGSNLTMGKVLEKVSEKKKKKKKASQLSSACMMEVRMTGVLPNS